MLFVSPGQVLAQSSDSQRSTSLKQIIYNIQEETGYYFLFRESQVAGINLSLTVQGDDALQILERLKTALSSENLDILIDEQRKQILLVDALDGNNTLRSIRISGYIVDAASGERLPYATITWQIDGQLKGVTSNSSGIFSLREETDDAALDFTISYLGYEKRTLSINPDESSVISDLTVRLEPNPLSGKEIIISGFSGYNPSDSLLAGIMRADLFSPLGEANSIRAIQNLPSVSNGAAINNGLNIRGSTPDGFRVLLDGMSIFNQSHLFGLLDSFNPDAIQSAGFYYGVSPAQIDTPTGGTLNLITRTGSMNKIGVSAGVSNTSVNATLDGPIKDRGSWLFSARSSYMDQISWFNNSDLIRWGLDIDRPRKITGDLSDFTDNVVRYGNQSALFYDFHGKFYLEGKNADRFILSGYLGGNDISQTAQRRTRSLSGESRFVFEDVEAQNEWMNALASIRYEREFNSSVFSSTLLGVSAYTSDFGKDDFIYNRISSSGDTESVLVFVYPFRNRSAMNEFRFHQDFQLKWNTLTTNAGANWNYYYAEYSEQSFDRPSYSSQTAAHLVDLYVQSRWEPYSFVELQGGIRGHYFSLGGELYAAPRGRISLKPSSWFNIYGGYSKNYQFLHKVTLQNNTTADVWTLSTADQPPAESSQFLAGFSLAPFSWLYFQTEAYTKEYRKLRSHELNTRSLANTFSEVPWFYQNDGDAKGVEFLLRAYLNRIIVTQTYSLSEMTFTNPFLLNGESFYADWDRTHSYSASMEYLLIDGLDINVSWLMMSGAPNKLFTFGTDSSTERLAPYQRLDAGISYTGSVRKSVFKAEFTVYNVLNRDNVWYRDYAFNFDDSQPVPRLSPVPVDVLDLGLQPSFKVSISF
ncbi:MAG: carboxypeptidase-like regulatory domain-containing protein [Balneolaceae bacterium]|nr:carboxypeptidase-like regulatory domain-containing protein [Balneolaceae bacterium]